MSILVLVGMSGIALSGFILALVLRQPRWFGCYTARIERSNQLKCQSDELTRQVVGRWMEHNDEMVARNEAILAALHKMRQELITERSA